MTLDVTQTLVVSRIARLDTRGASGRDLVLLAGNSGRWGPVQDQVGVSLLLICLTSRETFRCL